MSCKSRASNSKELDLFAELELELELEKSLSRELKLANILGRELEFELEDILRKLEFIFICTMYMLKIITFFS